MWLVSLIVSSLILICRHNKFLQTTLEPWNIIGIQIFNHVYAPFHNIHQKSSSWFDLVLIGRNTNQLHLYRVFHREHSVVPLIDVPIMHKLTYIENNIEKEHSYYPGSPFELQRGELILYQRKKTGFSFRLEEVARSKSWPISL